MPKAKTTITQKQYRELREKAAMFDELAGLLARRKNPVESGWLIEAPCGSNDHFPIPHWYAGDDRWTPDSLKAIRFCREEDAKKISLRCGMSDVFVSEHIWSQL